MTFELLSPRLRLRKVKLVTGGECPMSNPERGMQRMRQAGFRLATRFVACRLIFTPKHFLGLADGTRGQ